MRTFRLYFLFLRLFLGCAVLCWALGLPLISLALFFSVRAAAGVAVFLAVVPLATLFLLSEWGLLRILGGQHPRTHGLRNSYERACAAAGGELEARPALLTFADPIPDVFVIRALGGDGVILLSEGLISILDETELRFVLIRAIQRLMGSETTLQSVCVFGLALLGGRGSLREKVSVGFSSPPAAFRGLLLYPWLRFLSGIARELAACRTVRDAGVQDFTSGAAKLARASRLYARQSGLPGLVYLGIER